MVKENSNIYKVLLFTAALIWGSSFFIVKEATEVVPTNCLLAIRFATAALILAVVFFKHLRAHLKWEYVWRGCLLGAFLFIGYWFQTVGITDTTPGKNAFLTASYCVLVPFFFWAINKVRPDRYNLLAALLLVIGIGFVSLNGNLSIRFGDWMTIIGAAFFAAHIAAVAKFSQKRDIFVLTIFQFLSSAILAFIFAFATETFPAREVWTVDLIARVAFLAIACTAVALLFQNIGQKHVHPSAASILLSLESVFGIIFSVLLYGEAVTPRLVIGFTLIFIAVITSETKLSFLPSLPRKVVPSKVLPDKARQPVEKKKPLDREPSHQEA